jgi:hypothetical protein
MKKSDEKAKLGRAPWSEAPGSLKVAPRDIELIRSAFRTAPPGQTMRQAYMVLLAAHYATYGQPTPDGTPTVLLKAHPSFWQFCFWGRKNL